MNKASNKVSNLIYFVLIAAAMISLQGCVAVANVVKANHDVIAGKVYRLKVIDKWGFNDTNGYEQSDTGRSAFNKLQTLFKVYGGAPTQEQAVPYRFATVGPEGAWEGVTLFNNGPAGNAIAHINADVPLLRVGDIVDVYFHETASLSVKHQKYATVIRLVCMAKDKACAEREKGDHRKAYGWVVQPEGRFDVRLLNVVPQMDMNGHWIQGKEPKRPPLPEGGLSSLEADVSE